MTRQPETCMTVSSDAVAGFRLLSGVATWPYGMHSLPGQRHDGSI